MCSSTINIQHVESLTPRVQQPHRCHRARDSSGLGLSTVLTRSSSADLTPEALEDPHEDAATSIPPERVPTVRPRQLLSAWKSHRPARDGAAAGHPRRRPRRSTTTSNASIWAHDWCGREKKIAVCISASLGARDLIVAWSPSVPKVSTPSSYVLSRRSQSPTASPRTAPNACSKRTSSVSPNQPRSSWWSSLKGPQHRIALRRTFATRASHHPDHLRTICRSPASRTYLYFLSPSSALPDRRPRTSIFTSSRRRSTNMRNGERH